MRNKLGVVIIICLDLILVLLFKGLIGSIKTCYKHTIKLNVKKDISNTYKLEMNKLNDLSYYLYTPSNKKDNMPLIIYLHGNNNDITNENITKYLSDGYYDYLESYVVIPKLDSKYSNWLDINTQIVDLINYMYNNYNIDINRISLTGYDKGATGVYQLQTKIPNTFSCILPMNGNIKDIYVDTNKINKTKVWLYTSNSDNYTSSLINSSKITKYDGDYSLEYKNKDVINWLANCK